jgi:hypothetical protein
MSRSLPRQRIKMDRLLTDYGLIGIIIFIILDKIWPFISKKVYPEKLKQEEAKRKQEDKLVNALEGIAQGMTTLNAKMDSFQAIQLEKLNNLTQIHLDHNRMMTEAVTAMLVKTNTQVLRKVSNGKTARRSKV